MRKTLYDIIDSWTMIWDRGFIELVLESVSKPFYKHKLIFFLIEEIWDALERIDDPQEFMTEERKIKQIEKILHNDLNETAAKSLIIDIEESPEFRVVVINHYELIRQHPDWFEPWEGISWEEVASSIIETEDMNDVP